MESSRFLSWIIGRIGLDYEPYFTVVLAGLAWLFLGASDTPIMKANHKILISLISPLHVDVDCWHFFWWLSRSLLEICFPLVSFQISPSSALSGYRIILLGTAKRKGPHTIEVGLGKSQMPESITMPLNSLNNECTDVRCSRVVQRNPASFSALLPRIISNNVENSWQGRKRNE